MGMKDGLLLIRELLLLIFNGVHQTHHGFMQILRLRQVRLLDLDLKLLCSRLLHCPNFQNANRAKLLLTRLLSPLGFKTVTEGDLLDVRRHFNSHGGYPEPFRSLLGGLDLELPHFGVPSAFTLLDAVISLPYDRLFT